MNDVSMGLLAHILVDSVLEGHSPNTRCNVSVMALKLSESYKKPWLLKAP